MFLQEYAIYDSDINIDAGWMDPTISVADPLLHWFALFSSLFFLLSFCLKNFFEPNLLADVRKNHIFFFSVLLWVKKQRLVFLRCRFRPFCHFSTPPTSILLLLVCDVLRKMQARTPETDFPHKERERARARAFLQCAHCGLVKH